MKGDGVDDDAEGRHCDLLDHMSVNMERVMRVRSETHRPNGPNFVHGDDRRERCERALVDDVPVELVMVFGGLLHGVSSGQMPKVLESGERRQKSERQTHLHRCCYSLDYGTHDGDEGEVS